MPAISHCFRRDAVYYWRRWTPGPKRILLQLGLAVKDPRTARTLSSRLTARSEDLFPLWTAGQMNKTQLLEYLHQCLAQSRRQLSGDGLNELARGLAWRTLATRGLDAELTDSDRVAVDRQWGQPGLADGVSDAMRRTARTAPDLQDFVTRSIDASLSVGSSPSGIDAEQAMRVRWLADASLAFQAAKNLSIGDLGVDQLIDDIDAGKGLPDGENGGEPLADWLARTIAFISRYNPHADEGSTALDRIFDERPTALAEWITRSGPPAGSTEFDHVHLDRQLAELGRILEHLPAEIEKLRPSPGVGHSPAPQPMPEAGPSAKPAPEYESAKIVPAGDKLVDQRSRDGAWDVKTCNQARSTYGLLARFLEEEHGVVAFAEFKQRHLALFDELLRVVYTRYGQSPKLRNGTIAALRDFSAQQDETKRGLDIGTRSRHMGHIGALIEYVKNTEDLDPKLNPAAFTGKKQGRPRDERSIPAADTVASFFHAPIFTGCLDYEELHEPGPHIFHRAAYFGPMLAHYQGMRREEFCGLAVEDIVVGRGEHPYIHVCWNKIRRLKNRQSKRNLALHPELIRLGFLDYVERLRSLEITRVFPDLYNPTTSSPLG